VIIIAYLVAKPRRLNMNNINNINFIYDVINNICYIQEPNQPLRELTIKGSCEYQGLINGTWFQIDELVNHWISFRRNKFKTNAWQVFYKRIGEEQITYYRKVFYKVEKILAFSFSEKDEWIKDPISGKWKSKF
jgi:hypothetical protein